MANLHAPLTKGACLQLIEQDSDLKGFQPVLQCLSVKMLRSASTTSASLHRYRTIVSDGDNFIQGVLHGSLNRLVESGALTKNSIFTLTGFTFPIIANFRLLYILRVGEDSIIPYETRIGDPAAFEVKADPLLAAAASPTSGPAPESATMPAQQPVATLAPKPAPVPNGATLFNQAVDELFNHVEEGVR